MFCKFRTRTNMFISNLKKNTPSPLQFEKFVPLPKPTPPSLPPLPLIYPSTFYTHHLPYHHLIYTFYTTPPPPPPHPPGFDHPLPLLLPSSPPSTIKYPLPHSSERREMGSRRRRGSRRGGG